MLQFILFKSTVIIPYQILFGIAKNNYYGSCFFLTRGHFFVITKHTSVQHEKAYINRIHPSHGSFIHGRLNPTLFGL